MANHLKKKILLLSISIGMSRYDPEYSCSIDELLAKADRLMYKQKKKNRTFSVLRAV